MDTFKYEHVSYNMTIWANSPSMLTPIFSFKYLLFSELLCYNITLESNVFKNLDIIIT